MMYGDEYPSYRKPNTPSGASCLWSVAMPYAIVVPRDNKLLRPDRGGGIVALARQACGEGGVRGVSGVGTSTPLFARVS